MTQDKKAPDWERIEIDYRAGLLSLREIAKADGNVTEGAIRKRAKRDGWERNLGPRIQAQADALVRKEAVRSEVRERGKVTEQVIVAAVAEQAAQVRIRHQAAAGKAQTLVQKLLAELEHQTDNGDLYEQLGELLIDPPDEVDGQAAVARQLKRKEIFERAMSLGGRTKTMKDLADTLKTLIALEREAYDIGATQAPNDPPPGAAADQDIARRIAFLLAQGLQSKG